MGFASKSQKRRLEALVKAGKFSQESFEKMQKETKSHDLPEKSKYKPKGLTRRPRRTK
jgi:hypothetical protein